LPRNFSGSIAVEGGSFGLAGMSDNCAIIVFIGEVPLGGAPLSHANLAFSCV
jgi:hypothetical protein